jgi:hypothetical protein
MKYSTWLAEMSDVDRMVWHFHFKDFKWPINFVVQCRPPKTAGEVFERYTWLDENVDSPYTWEEQPVPPGLYYFFENEMEALQFKLTYGYEH